MLELLSDPNTWIALATLTAMEIVLGIDNIVFISVIVSRLPQATADRARQLGLLLALLFRVLLLLILTWLIGLTQPVVTQFGLSLSWKDIILIAGGVFLVYKATHEMHNAVEEPHEGGPKPSARASFTSIIVQIIVVDMVFSIDSIVTAIGMAQHVEVMIAAVVIAVGIMYAASGTVAGFIARHPTTKMLALAFLLLIGVTLAADGLGFHIDKGYIYAAMAFSVAVEAVNIFSRQRRTKNAPQIAATAAVAATTGAATTGGAVAGARDEVQTEVDASVAGQVSPKVGAAPKAVVMSNAIVVHAVGGPEVLAWQEWPVGTPGPGQILVRQHAVGINFADVYQRTGLYPAPFPFVAGNEGAGEVLAVGPDVTEIGPGDRIAYQGTPGAYAEERLLPAAKAVQLPDGISYETAAATLLKGTTVYYLLHRTWPLKAGETILFHAAAGGVGLIACQWAKALGATVIGTASSAEKLALALAYGATHVINYRTENFAARVREITAGKGVDVVYDGNGQDTFEASLDCLRPLGLMVSYGNASGPVAIPDLGILARKGSLFLTRPTGATYFSSRADLLTATGALFAAVLSGLIKPVIGQRFALRDAAAAHRALEGRTTTGSTLLLP